MAEVTLMFGGNLGDVGATFDFALKERLFYFEFEHVVGCFDSEY